MEKGRRRTDPIRILPINEPSRTLVKLKEWVDAHEEDAWLPDLSDKYAVIDAEYLRGEIQRLIQNARKV